MMGKRIESYFGFVCPAGAGADGVFAGSADEGVVGITVTVAVP